MAAACLVAGGCNSTLVRGGTGGSSATGGIPGTGGTPGTGGGPGAGGVIACAASNGCMGIGGIPARDDGGTGVGPGHDGGIDGSRNTTCLDLDRAYGEAVQAALACTPGAPGQCQALVALSPTPCLICGNQAYVNDATQIEAALQSYVATCAANDAGCGMESSCTPPLPRATCLPTSPGASTGTCFSYQFDAGAFDAGAPAGPDGGETCQQLALDYAAAVNAAQTCTPGAPNQCQGYAQSTVPGSAEPCGCTLFVSVNDPSVVKDPWQRWGRQCAPPCAGVICPPPPPPGVCVPVDSGGPTGGICLPQ